MVSCKVCWSVKRIDCAVVGSLIRVLLSTLGVHPARGEPTVSWLPNQICDLLSIPEVAIIVNVN
jgi:hypothetical protein